jgi:hypothetical protein
VAVGPLVVARRVEQRHAEAIELGADHLEVLRAAHRRAVLDVAHVKGEVEARLCVDPVDPTREGGDLGVAVRDVADDSEGERGGLVLAG